MNKQRFGDNGCVLAGRWSRGRRVDHTGYLPDWMPAGEIIFGRRSVTIR